MKNEKEISTTFNKNYFTFSSHNLNSQFSLLEMYLFTIKNNEIICIQDIGITSEAQAMSIIRLRNLSVSFLSCISNSNSSRSVGILLGEDWKFIKYCKYEIGSVIGAIVSNNHVVMNVLSMYLPPCLDGIKNFDSKNQHIIDEVNVSYKYALNWINSTPKNLPYIVGGDFNETRSIIDRERDSYHIAKDREKFINQFLYDANGCDSWRSLYRNTPGYTRFQNFQSASRLDYIIISNEWWKKIKHNCEIDLGNKNACTSDHVQIKLTIKEDLHLKKLPNRCWSIFRPKIFEKINDDKFNTQIKIKWNSEKFKYGGILQEITEFTKFIRNEYGNKFGWKGGNAGYVRSKESHHLYQLISNLCSFASLVRMDNEIKINDKRRNELIDYYFRNLKKHEIIPFDIDTTNIENWIEKNLLKKIGKLRLDIHYEDDLISEWKTKEKVLFSDIKKRTSWLNLIGFGKNNDKIPNSLKNNDQIITDPNDIKIKYYQVFAPNFESYFNLNHEIYYPKICLPNLKNICFFHAVPPYPQGKKPIWWNHYYQKNSKFINQNIYKTLLDPFTIDEIEAVINEIEYNLSPDLNGNHSSLIKNLFFPGSSLNGTLCQYFNELLNYGNVPDEWKKYYLVPIPKSGESNNIDTLFQNTRPLGICHEYNKIFSKILTKRLNLILLNNKILHESQLGFIRNGNIHQGLTTLINIFEDTIQKQKLNNKTEFYCISYDMKKAYDSVQFFSIRATFERFNFPDKFILLMENLLFYMNGQVKTFYGLSNEFKINRSLRQGDPLAPIIFALFTDVLHEGIEKNPLCKYKSMGYKFATYNNNIASIGYADDLIVFNENWENNYYTHEWIRNFLSAHGGSLNAKKTIYLINNAFGNNDKRWLHNVEGDIPIYPSNDTTIRYLGLKVNLNLNWEEQIKSMNQSINYFCYKLKNSRISTLKAIEVVKTVLITKLDIGLTHATITEKQLKKWNRKIIKTLFEMDGWSYGLTHNLSEVAFTEITKCNLLVDRYWGNHLKELYYNINSNNIDYVSCLNRLSHVTKLDQLNNLNLYNKSFKNIKKESHYIQTLEFFNKYEIQFHYAPKIHPTILKIISYFSYKLRYMEEIYMFTDGSTIQNNPVSGIGIHVPHVNININFSMTTYGNNFTAEVVAIAICVAAVHLTNIKKCQIFTDSYSTIQAIKNDKSIREWCRTPLRGWIKLISTFSKFNGIEIKYVKSHTNKTDTLSVGNQRADLLAKSADKNDPIPLNSPDLFNIYLYRNDQCLLNENKK